MDTKETDIVDCFPALRAEPFVLQYDRIREAKLEDARPKAVRKIHPE